VGAVRNPMGATGAVDPEPIEDVRRFAPQAMGTNARAVTPEDHVAIVETHPQVSKAAATLRWTGSWYTMFVTVDRKGGLDVDAAFEEEIEAFLEPYRMMGRDVEVDGPRFVPLDIALTVCTEPGHAVGDVLTALTRRFSARDHADGTRGFFHPDELTFGQPVYLSAVIAAAMAVPGVRFVHTRRSAGVTMRFQRWGRAADGEIEAGEISLGRLEIARCASDPNTPEHGRITFDVRSEA
jgi:predicted phage baseplate assembly protein